MCMLILSTFTINPFYPEARLSQQFSLALGDRIGKIGQNQISRRHLEFGGKTQDQYGMS